MFSPELQRLLANLEHTMLLADRKQRQRLLLEQHPERSYGFHSWTPEEQAEYAMMYV